MTAVLHAVDVMLLTLVVVTAIATTMTRSLLASSMLLGIYSLLMATTWVKLQAPDVAFTEAAVGAGISTVILLATLARTGWEEKAHPRLHWPALLITVAAGLALAWAATDLPSVGDPSSPARQHLGLTYLERAPVDTGVPNIVTAVLVSYRGLDTLFETTVVFTAGASVLLLLRSGRKMRRPEERES